jgi:hypothetical protein
MTIGKERFLRIEDVLANLDLVRMAEYKRAEKMLRIYFSGGDTLTVGMMEPDGFERIASLLLKHEE